MTRWYEDIPIDDIFPLGDHVFTEQEIIHFASIYDPQYLHTSTKDAAHSQFGGLIASGWHTVCVGQRLMVDMLTKEEARLRSEGQEPGVSGPSPGVNNMSFKTPVRPGDRVTYNLQVTSKRLSKSLPGWGILINRVHAVNQHGNLVYQADLVSFSKLRDFKPSLKMRILLWMAQVPLLKAMVRR